jgi:hypothetical protein
MVLESAS